MSEWALAGICVGIGLLISAIVIFAGRDEVAAGLRQRFGGETEPGPLALESPSPAERRKRRVVVAFGGLSGVCLLIVGILYGQVLAIVAGAIGLGEAAHLGWSSRRQGLL